MAAGGQAAVASHGGDGAVPAVWHVLLAGGLFLAAAPAKRVGMGGGLVVGMVCADGVCDVGRTVVKNVYDTMGACAERGQE